MGRIPRPRGGFNQFPQQPGPMMDVAMVIQEWAERFPPPRSTHMGMQGGQPGWGMPNRQQGGFRTLKQTIITVNCPKGGVKQLLVKNLPLHTQM